MGLCELKMALPVPDDCLLCFSLCKIIFMNQNDISFIQDWFCHLALSLHLIVPKWISQLGILTLMLIAI